MQHLGADVNREDEPTASQFVRAAFVRQRPPHLILRRIHANIDIRYKTLGSAAQLRLALKRRIKCCLAEAVRFELTNGLPRRRFSRPVPSTARPRFQASYSNLPSSDFLHLQGFYEQNDSISGSFCLEFNGLKRNCLLRCGLHATHCCDAK